jgi:hypothetical protein
VLVVEGSRGSGGIGAGAVVAVVGGGTGGAVVFVVAGGAVVVVVVLVVLVVAVVVVLLVVVPVVVVVARVVVVVLVGASWLTEIGPGSTPLEPAVPAGTPGGLRGPGTAGLVVADGPGRLPPAALSWRGGPGDPSPGWSSAE